VKITTELLKKYKACEKQVERFGKVYPNGVEANGENALLLDAKGFDVLWAITFLPQEGLGSRREFALWCAEQVAHLTNDLRIKRCLRVVRQEVEKPGSQNLISARIVADAACAASWTLVHATSWNVRRIQAAIWVARSVALVTTPSTYWPNDKKFLWTAAEVARTARNAVRVAQNSVWDAARNTQVFRLGEMLKEL